jgi:hypothetical protein
LPVFYHGFQFGLTYTCGRTLAATGADGDFGRIDNLTRFANYGPVAAIGRRHTFAANYIYDLSAMFGQHEIVDSLMDGWRIPGLTRFQSGAPFSVSTIGNQQLEDS